MVKNVILRVGINRLISGREIINEIPHLGLLYHIEKHDAEQHFQRKYTPKVLSKQGKSAEEIVNESGGGGTDTHLKMTI